MDFPDERTSLSAFSPGVVLDEEQLLRSGLDPAHLNDDGALLPSTIPMEHLKFRPDDPIGSGFSVDRRNHADRAIVEGRLHAQSRKHPGQEQLDFVIPFLCAEVRQIKDHGGLQAVLVLDSALEHNRAHAALVAARVYQKDSQYRQIRDAIRDLWQSKPRLTLDELFSG